MITLADAMKKARPNLHSTAVPAKAVILDSCPGDSDVKKGVYAFSAGIQNPVAKFATVCLLWVVFGVLVAYTKILRQPDLFDAMHKRLLDGSVLPHSALRTYIYSSADRIISERAIERHAFQSKNAGMDVQLVKYTTTAHVNHMKEDPKRYWTTVQSTWDRAKAR